MKKTVYSMLQVLFLFVLSTCGILSAEAQTQYHLVKSDADIVAGSKYIIASMASGDGFVMKKYESGNNCRQESANSVNGTITATATMAELTLENVSDGVWAFKDADGKYMTVTSEKANRLKFLSTNIDQWSKFNVNVSGNNVATISCVTQKGGANYTVKYNETSSLFAAYKSGQKDVYLYKQGNSASEKKVVSISISGTPSVTKYVMGDVPSVEGLTVNATFSDQSTADVTSAVKWTFDPEILSLDTKQVTATATYEEKTATTTFDVTVEKDYDYDYTLENQSCVSANADKVEWDANVCGMTLEKGTSSTVANNYVGTSKDEIRGYKGQKLTITPRAGVSKIVLVSHDGKSKVNAAIQQNNIQNATLEVKEAGGTNINHVILTPTNQNEPVVININDKIAFKTLILTHVPFSLKITEAGYATLYIPYNAMIPEGLSAYAAKDDGQKVTLIERGDKLIAANEGVVVKGAQGEYELMASAATPTTIDGNEMVGVLKDTQLGTKDNAYLLTKKNSDKSIAFRLLQTTYTLGANRAYLKSKVQNPSRVLLSVYDAVETGIDAIEEEENQTVKNGAIYNLSGQRMSRMHKGINIVNGKLVIR